MGHGLARAMERTGNWTILSQSRKIIPILRTILESKSEIWSFEIHFSHMHIYYYIECTNKKPCTYRLKGIIGLDLTMIKTG